VGEAVVEIDDLLIHVASFYYIRFCRVRCR
jgi:hypothetical protein